MSASSQQPQWQEAAPAAASVTAQEDTSTSARSVSTTGPVDGENGIGTGGGGLKSMFHLPQWMAQGLHSYQHDQPQWGDEQAEVASKDTLPDDQLCASCKQNIRSCKCSECFKCHGTVRMGTRHHCRKCWRTTCSSCRSRTRYLNPCSPKNTAALVCDCCAIYHGLTKLPQGTDFMGLYMLREAADLPNTCVGRKCGIESYDATCPSCSLPTVPVRAHLERLVRVQYCCSWTNKCAKCSNAEQRMAKEENTHRLEREKFFNAITPAVQDELFDLQKRQLEGVFDSVSEEETRKLLLATIASSVCYEYDFYPNTTLSLSDIPYAKLLHLRETRQAYSVFEGPNKTMYIAFPGTHDLRTTITDVKFSRVTQAEWGNVHDGLRSGHRPGGIGQDTQGLDICGPVHKLWEYKVHSGFYEEEVQLRKKLPTSVCRSFVEQGYNLVICGHSLGGALAALTTLRHLNEDLPTFAGKILCVTLGAPLIGNSALTRKIQRCGWNRYFHHLVYRSDIVPRLLTGRKLPHEAVRHVKRKITGAVSSVKGKVVGLLSRAPFFGSGSSSSATDGEEAAGSPKANDQMLTPGVILEVDQHEISQCYDDDYQTSYSLAGDTARLDGSATMANNASSPLATSTTAGSGTPSSDPSVSSLQLLLGAKRSFDCYGRYHFMSRDVHYKSTDDPTTAFKTLKSGDRLPVVVADHLLGNYNRALMFRVEK